MDSDAALEVRKTQTTTDVADKAGGNPLQASVVEASRGGGQSSVKTSALGVRNPGKGLEGGADKREVAMEDAGKSANGEAQEKGKVAEPSNLAQFLALEEFSTAEIKRSRYVELENAKLFAIGSFDNHGSNAVPSNSSYLSQLSLESQKKIAEGLRDAQSLARERSRQLGLALAKLEKWMVRVSAKKRNKFGNQAADRDGAANPLPHATSHTIQATLSNQHSSSNLPPFPSPAPPAASDDHTPNHVHSSATLTKKTPHTSTVAGKRGSNFEAKKDSEGKEPAMDNANDKAKNAEYSTPNKKIRSAMTDSREIAKQGAQAQKKVWGGIFHASPKPSVSAPSSSEGHTDPLNQANENGVEMKILKGKRTRIKPDNLSTNNSSELGTEKVQATSSLNDGKTGSVVTKSKSFKGEINGDLKTDAKMENKGIKNGLKAVVGSDPRPVKSDFDDSNAGSEDRSVPVNSTSKDTSHDLSPEHNSKVVVKVKASRSQRSNSVPLNAPNTQNTLHRSSSTRKSIDGSNSSDVAKGEPPQSAILNKKRQMKPTDNASPSSESPISFRPQKTVKLLNSNFSSGSNKNEKVKDTGRSTAPGDQIKGKTDKGESTLVTKQVSEKRNPEKSKDDDDKKYKMNAKADKLSVNKESTEGFKEKRADELTKRIWVGMDGKNSSEDKSKKKFGVGVGSKEEKGFGGSRGDVKSVKNAELVSQSNNVLRKTTFQRSSSSSMKSSYDDGTEMDKRSVYEEERMSLANETKGKIGDKGNRQMERKNKSKITKNLMSKDRFSPESELESEDEVEEEIDDEEEVEDEDEEEDEEEEMDVDVDISETRKAAHTKVTNSDKETSESAIDVVHRLNRSKRRLVNTKPKVASETKNDKNTKLDGFGSIKNSKNKLSMEKGEKNSTLSQQKTCEDVTLHHNFSDQDYTDILNIFREVIKLIIENGGKFSVCPNNFLKGTEVYFANISSKDLEFLNHFGNANVGEIDMFMCSQTLSNSQSLLDPDTHNSQHLDGNCSNKSQQIEFLKDKNSDGMSCNVDKKPIFEADRIKNLSSIEKRKGGSNDQNSDLEYYYSTIIDPQIQLKNHPFSISELLLSALIDIPGARSDLLNNSHDDESSIRFAQTYDGIAADTEIRKVINANEPSPVENGIEARKAMMCLKKGQEPNRKNKLGNCTQGNGFLNYNGKVTTELKAHSHSDHFDNRNNSSKGVKHEIVMKDDGRSSENGLGLQVETETKTHNLGSEFHNSQETNLNSQIVMELHSIGIIIENTNFIAKDELSSQLDWFENELKYKAQENRKRLSVLRNKIEIEKEKRETEKEILNRLTEIAYFFQMGSKSSQSSSLPSCISKLHTVPKSNKMSSLFMKHVLEIIKQFEAGCSLFDIEIVKNCMESMNKAKSQSQPQTLTQNQKSKAKVKVKSNPREELEACESDEIEHLSIANRQVQSRSAAPSNGLDKVKKSNGIKQNSFREKISKSNEVAVGRKNNLGTPAMVQASNPSSIVTHTPGIAKDSKKDVHLRKKKNSLEKERNLKAEESTPGLELPSVKLKRKRSERDSDVKGGSKRYLQKASSFSANETPTRDGDQVRMKHGNQPATPSQNPETSYNNKPKDLPQSDPNKKPNPEVQTWSESAAGHPKPVENLLDGVDLDSEIDLGLVGAAGDLKWFSDFPEDAALLHGTDGAPGAAPPFDFAGGLACPMDDLSEIGFY